MPAALERRVLLLALLPGLILAAGSCASRRPAAEYRSPVTATILPAQDPGQATGPRLRVTVPYRALVFSREDGSLEGGLEVTVVAWRDGKRVGGTVASSHAALDDWQESGSDSLVVVDRMIPLQGDGPVELEVRARSLGTSRIWTRRIPCPPEAWTPLPYLLVDWRWNADATGLLPVTAGSLGLQLALVRVDGVPWPEEGLRARARISQDHGPTQDLSRPLRADLVHGDTLFLDLDFPVEELPLGHYRVGVGLGLGENAGPLLQGPPARHMRSLRLDLESEDRWRQHLVWLEGSENPADLEDLETMPSAGRSAALAALFAGPEDQRQHLDRILEADARFPGTRRGAATDRGKALIRHGAPDRVEHRGSPGDRYRRWEIWYFDPAGPVLTFLDAHGLGDYRLIRREEDEAP